MSTSANYATVVQELYVAYFGRPADPTGLQNFEAALAAANAPTTLAGLSADYATNPAIAALVNAFGDSGESGRLYGTAISASAGAAQQFVTAVFEDLFNRAPLQAGLTFWSNALLTGSMTPGEAAMEIALGAGTADAATFANKIAAASTFTADLIAGNLTPGYSGPVAAADGRAFLAGITSSTTAATYQAGATTAIDNMLGISPTPTPTPSATTLSLTIPGDSIHLNDTTAASTVTLSGADLTAYPSGTYGTVAELVTAGITSVTDSGGNFTLNASGNDDATTFNFGTGVVSGSDAASSAGITYMGVTTYVTSTHGDTVTLSAGTQNVTGAASGNDTVNLAALTYTGTLAFGAAGAETLNATVGGNLGGGTITSGGATVALVLSAAGTETLSTEEFNLITTGADSGGLTFTSGTAATDHVTFSDAGTVTAIAGVGNYNLATGTNSITLNNVADNVTGNANSGTDTVNLAALAYTGTIAFGSGGTDTVDVTVGGNISGGSVTSQGATAALALSGAGTETLNTAEYNLFNVGGITGGSFGGNTITLSNAGTVTANASVGNYDLSTAGNTIMLNNVADDVNGAASGADTVNLAALVYTGTVDFGASGSDTIEVAGTSNISGGTINTGGATVALLFNVAGNETMTTTQYNLFNATGITGGSVGGNTITFSDAGTVTANANVGHYDLSTAGNTITLNSAADNVAGAASGDDTVNLGALAYTGTLAFGAAGADTLNATVSGNLSGATALTSGGATVALVLSAAGTETLSTGEYNLITTGVDAGGLTFTGGAIGTDTVVFSNAGTVTAISNVGTYDLSTAGNAITLNNVADNVHGAASGNDTVNLAALAYTGTVAFGAAGADTIDVSGGNISGGTISGGTTVALVFSSAGAETMTTAQYNLFNTTSITGGTFGGNIIAFSDAGTVTANANVGTYDLATAGNTITLNNVADDVTGAPSGNDTVNLAALTYTGTVAFGGAGADTINATVGHDISGATIGSGGATVALVLSAAGTETLSTEEFNLITTGADSGGLTFTGGALGTDHVTFSDAGTVTAISNVGNYDLSAAGNTITLNNVADNVTGTPSSDNNVYLGPLAYTGTLTFGGGSLDQVYATIGSDLSGATIGGASATGVLVLSADGTETLNTAEYNFFNGSGGISFTVSSGPSNDTIVFSDAGTVTDNANVGNYDLSTAGNTITLDDVGSHVNGAASGNDIVDLFTLTYTGTLAFGASGADSIHGTVGHDISGATISSGGATVALVLSAAGTETVSTEEFNLITTGAYAGGITFTGGTLGTDTLTFSDSGTVTAISNVGNYDLYTGGDTSIGLDNVADNVTDSGTSGGDEFVLSALTYTGTITVGSAGATDFVEADSGGDISGATFTSGGVGVDLEVIGSGTETISAAEVGLFSATGIVFTAGSDNTLIVNPGTNSPVTIVDSDLANFGNVQNIQIDTSGSGVQSITLGGNFSALISSLTTTSSTGTITIDASATTAAATLTASSTSAGGDISITTGTGGDTVNATIVAGSTLSVTSNGTDTITLNSGAGTASIVANGVDTIDLGAGHTNGNDTLTLYQTAIGTDVTSWKSNDTLDLSIANFTGANAIYGNSGTVSTIAAQTAHTENIVTFVAGQTSNVGDDLYNMGTTTFANAAALATYLDNPVNALTFASGTVPAAGASLLFEYEDTSGNAHLALVQLANGAVDTTVATAVDIAEFVGVASTASLHNIHLT